MSPIRNPEALGWDEWFDKQARNHCDQAGLFARVAAVDRDQFLLLNEEGSFRGKLSGKYRFETDSPERLPCVGDWVCADKNPGDEFGVIRAVLERKTFLQRKAVGQSFDCQLISANVDVVFIVQSCHYDFNIKRLERYLVMVAEGGALPYVLLSKTDLIDTDALTAQVDRIRRAGMKGPVLALSNVTKEGIDELYHLLSPGKTYCFVGSSGVGKSTIINGLVGRKRLETRDVSGTGEGRHTTIRRELILLDNGAMVIDNPGMREFGVMGTGDGIDAGFPDISRLVSACRFRDCTHTGEAGCAVLKAIEEGTIDQDHYDNYIKLRKESDFNRMSYAEKRKKDRQFGRFIKNVKKGSHRD